MRGIGPPVDVSFDAVQRSLDESARFRQETAEFLKRAFPGKGFETEFPTDTYVAPPGAPPPAGGGPAYEGRKDSYERFVDRHVEQRIAGNLEQYQGGRVDQRWWNNFFLYNLRNRDEERWLDNHRLDAAAEDARAQRRADEDRAYERSVEERMELDRLQRAEMDRRDTELQLERQMDERRRADRELADRLDQQRRNK